MPGLAPLDHSRALPCPVVVLVVGGCCRAGVVWAGDCLQVVGVVSLVLVSKVSQLRAALVAGALGASLVLISRAHFDGQWINDKRLSNYIQPIEYSIDNYV